MLEDCIKINVNSIGLFALNACHESNFLCSLNDVGTIFLTNQFAVLKESFISWEAICKVAKGHKSKSPNSSTAELSFIFHSIGTVKDSAAMEPALHKFTFIPEETWKLCWNHHKYLIKCAQRKSLDRSYIEPSGKFITPSPEQTPFTKDPSCIFLKAIWSMFIASTINITSFSYHIGFHLAIINVPNHAFGLFDSIRQYIEFHLITFEIKQNISIVKRVKKKCRCWELTYRRIDNRQFLLHRLPLWNKSIFKIESEN